MIVHLIGKGPGFKEAPAPADTIEDIEDHAYHVWGVNDSILWKPCDVIFNMHDMAHVTEQEKICAIMAETKDIPLYSIKKYDWLANSAEYPLEGILAKYRIPYFSDSICYMIAMAIYSGATEIHTWGINMHSVTRDFRERYCVEFWIGFAMGQGVDVIVNEPTALLKTNETNQMYGYDCYFNYNKIKDKSKREWGIGGIGDKSPDSDLL